ncbi:hypothetical protein [Gemmiger sp.]
MKGKRILSAVLSAALLLQLSPLVAFAEDTTPLPDTISTVQSEPAPELLAEPTPEPTVEPATALPPEPEAEPTATPTPNPTAEPTATPAAETPAPDATAEPTPEPTVEPTATPDAAEQVQALIDALPDADAVTADTADEVEEQLTAIDDAKATLTDEQLGGLDFARYDAAANALLALWGEAPTDELETLDTYAEPTKDPTDNYYQITNESELRWFAQAVNGGKKSIKARLMNDIPVNNSTQWTPIGTERKPFEGIFDGNGKTITGLTCTDQSKDYVGLVGYANGATIQNVTVKDSNFNGNKYIGAVCGFIVGSSIFSGTITGCTNSGSTVKGWRNSGSSGDSGWHIGGIVGRANDATVQRCVNTGNVTGINDIGGIVGSTKVATVQDCGNTGEVTGIGKYYGGIAGAVAGSSNQIHNCYNAHSSTADKIYGNGSCSHSNCYYLANDTGSSGSTDKEITAKTAEQFASGEVAFLLQGNRPEPVWGQKIGTNDYPKLGGNKVYQTTPCTGRYSNSENQPLDHNYVDGVCSLCGEHEPPKEVNGYYQITNQWQLYWFANQVNTVNPAINAKLMNNITINSGVLNGNGELNTGASTTFTPWAPIGTEAQPFTGTFDGGGYTIYGLYIDGTADYVGLFGYVDTNGKVVNVTLADSYVRGNNNVGSICGWNNGGTLQNCHNAGTVSGTKNVGGVCGKNSSTLENSSNTGKVSGTGDHVGGVCGFNAQGGTVKGCYNTTGEVSGTTQNVGGVCGCNYTGGTVNGCYNTGKVTGTGNCIGGVCGQNGGTVKGCYNTGDVTGTDPVGSVCGWNGGTAENCYYLAGTSEKAVGGEIGISTNCESKTKLQFRNGDVAFCLQKDLGTTAPQVWGQRIGNTGETDKTPVLSNNPDYAVHPTATDSLCKGYSNKPNQTFNEHEYDAETHVCSRCGESEPLKEVSGYYEIYNQGQLRLFAELVNNTPSDSETKLNARLMKDIAMDGTEWTPIGTNAKPFTGTFDGNGNTITGLTCTDTSAYYVGLVGYASGATIQNVTVKESAFNGNSYIGAVCGRIVNGTITNCHAVKTTIGELGRNNYPQYCGGIVGEPAVRDDGTCVVTDCTNSGTVSGRFDLGGIAGQVDHATVQRCFNTGIVTGSNSEIGGIAGRVAYATVQRCFNSGAVTGGWPSIGGIAGKADGATVQDCGNTGAVKRTNNSNECGGIVGQGQFGGSIQNCYNAVSNMAYPIFFKYDGAVPSLSNCYYLADNPGTDPTAKTAAQFASGEVAYLLQGERTDTTTVWGQTLTEPNKQDFPVPGGEKVYQSAPCKIEYTNTESKTVEHDFDNGYCKNCGQPQIAYTVTIPASVELGNTATITAKGVTLPDDKRLNVKVADDSKFEVMLDGDTRTYTVTNKDEDPDNPNGTPVTPGDTVLTAENGNNKTAYLQFNKPETTTYSGEYKGTVKFTVSVDDKPAS